MSIRASLAIGVPAHRNISLHLSLGEITIVVTAAAIAAWSVITGCGRGNTDGREGRGAAGFHDTCASMCADERCC